ncbi:MAG TPA: AMIN domain-containing protein [Candidatus Acidoferrum sp.]|nr:AMIN domain-containing protein [Candidatus Acidoferrum sp.]
MESARWIPLTVTLMLGLVATCAPIRGDEAHAASKLEDVSVVTEGDSVVVRLATSQLPRYRVELLDGPYRVVLDLDDTVYAWSKRSLVTTAGALVQVRGSQFRKDVARVVLQLKSRVPYSVREEGDALVVELTTGSTGADAPAPSGRQPTVVARAAVMQTPPKDPATSATPPPAAPAAVPLISLEFKDAEVVNLLRILASESGRNIVIGDDVKGRMSISLHNVPWTLALQTILEARGLERLDRDGVIRIVTVEQLTKEREARARIEEAKVKSEIEIRTKRAEAEAKEMEVQQRKRAAEAAVADAIARGPLTEAAIRMAYADPGEVANTLQGLLGLGPGASEIQPCRMIKQEPGKREVTFARGGGGASEGPTRGPIAEPPFSSLFGPPREEGASKQAPPPVEDVTSKRRTIRSHCATNTLFLRLHATDLERVRRLIRESLDIPAPQVKIEARMEILERDDLFAIGVQWGGGGVLAVDGNRNVIVGRGFTSDFLTNPVSTGIPPSGVPPLSNPNLGLGQAIPVSSQTGLPSGGNLINLPIGSLLQGAAPAGAGGIAFGIIGSRLNLNLALEALRTQGKTVTLARPDIVTLENNLARISLGEEIPFATVSSAGTQVQFKEALLQLTVIPTVVREALRNKIRLTVMVENNSRGNVVNLGASGAPPAINRRSAETDVLINEGDHLVIGGIMTSVQTEEVRKVPMFGDVPLLGWLFKQRGTQQTRRELAVFITPMVLKDSSPEPAPPRPASAPGAAR